MRLAHLGWGLCALVAVIALMAIPFAASAAPGVADPLLLSPQGIDKTSNATVTAGGGFTNRWSYTVPAGREFRLETALVQAIANNGATVSEALICATPPGGSSCTGIVDATGNTVATPSFYNINQFQGAAYYPAGTVFDDFVNLVGSTNQTAVTSMHGTEFAAP